MELGVNRLNQILAAPFSIVGKALHMISSVTPWRCIRILKVSRWFRSLDSVVAIYLRHAKLVRQGEKVDGGSERGISAVDEIVKIPGHSSLESVHHHLHLLLHRLYLCDNRGWSRIHEGWDAYILPLQSVRGVTAFRSFAVSSLNTGIF